MPAFKIADTIYISRFLKSFDHLNKSQVDANMKNWQIYANSNFCDYIYVSGFCVYF
jgi:hypothetical protein